jgi:hypothetical protein
MSSIAKWGRVSGPSLIQAMKYDLNDLLRDHPDDFGVDALRIVWHYYASIRRIENSGQSPVIPPEEFLSPFSLRQIPKLLH